MSRHRHQKVRRFRANPIEVAIFSIISLVFCHSIYSLFYESQADYPAIFASTPSSSVFKGRAPASIPSSSLQTVTLQCDPTSEKETQAHKVRLSGPLCGIADADETRKVSSAQISNAANQYQATVFTDIYSGKFSTDYIPLNPGKNPIHIEFHYGNGKIVSQDTVLNKTGND